MRLLFCCEFYFPSVGGVQEVMRQIAERLVGRGHDVTVATTRLANRDFSEHNGVKIVEFGVTGNLVRGMEGELGQYRTFVTSFDCDAVMIKAAQQWTFDALWPILDRISARKVFIPCGFSGLYEPTYTGYFEDLPSILRKFDHLIFYADNYRDVDFARRHQIEPFSILANGASEIEFGVKKDLEFRRAHGIPEDSAVLLTVGSLTGVKGHRELLEAFVRLKTSRRHVTFIMNGNPPPKPMVAIMPRSEGANDVQMNLSENSDFSVAKNYVPLVVRIMQVYKRERLAGIMKRILRRWSLLVMGLSSASSRCAGVCAKVHRVWSEEGWVGLRLRAIHHLVRRLERSVLLIRLMPPSVRDLANPMAFWMAEARRPNPGKLLIISDYSRDELVQAYMTADLFVFASNIEYSPLVLFEAVAAGTPFLSVPVGNAEEIARWTGGGIICPADKDERGYTRVAPLVLAREIAKAIESPERLLALGKAGHAAWRDRYTWDAIAMQYEAILQGGQTPVGQGEKACLPV